MQGHDRIFAFRRRGARQQRCNLLGVMDVGFMGCECRVRRVRAGVPIGGHRGADGVLAGLTGRPGLPLEEEPCELRPVGRR